MSILDSAQVLLQAKNYSGSGDWLDENNSHDAQFGTGTPGTNDPLFISRGAFDHCFFPGATTNYTSVPDISNLDGTGTLEYIAKIKLDDWTPSSDQIIISKWSGSDGWLFYLKAASNDLNLIWNEGSTRIAEATSLPTVSDGDWLWVRAVATEDGADRDVFFYTSTDTTTDPDAVTWTQLGNEAVITSGAGNLTANTVAVFVGAESASAKTMAGSVAVARVNFNGTTQLDINYADATEPFATFTERSGNAATVTITRGSSGRVTTIVDQDMFLLTTDDYFEIADNANLDIAANEDLVTMVVFRTNTVAAGSDILLAKKDSGVNDAGYTVVRAAATSKGIIADGTNEDDDTKGTIAIHTLHTAAVVRNTTNDNIEAFLDGIGSGSATTDSTTSTLANALPLRIGATSGTAGLFFEGQIIAVAQWPPDTVLTDAEVLEAHERLTQLRAFPPFHRRQNTLVRM